MNRALLVGDRAPHAFKEQALGPRRAERASPEKADHSEQANQTPSQGVCVWCARCVFFCARKGYVKAKSSGATQARSLCFIKKKEVVVRPRPRPDRAQCPWCRQGTT